MEKVRLGLLAGLFAGMLALRAPAQTVTWQNPTVGDWFDTANWLDDTAANRLPTIGDTARIDNLGTATITTGTASATRLVLGSDPAQAGSVSLSGGTLQLNGTISLTAGGYLGIGGNTGGVTSGGTGIFTQSGDSWLATNEIRCGITSSGGTSNGTYTMSGGTLVMAGGGDFFAFGSGAAANGTFIQSAGNATVGNVFIGRTQGNGTLNMGGSSVMTVKSSVFIGGTSGTDGGTTGYGTFGGNAVMNFTAPGENFRIGQGTSALNGAARGTFNMAGGTITLATTSIGMIVGDAGIGTLNQSGGTLSTVAVNLGRNSGIGYLDFSGGTILLTNGIVVGGNAISSAGRSGVGTVVQSGNSFLQTASSSNVGFGTTSPGGFGTYLFQNGTIRITGTGNNGLFVVGNNSTGSGTFIQSGGVFDGYDSGNFQISRSDVGSKGYARLEGGIMNIATLSFGTAGATHTFEWTGGTLNAKNVTLAGTTTTVANNGGTLSPGGAAAVGTTTFLGNESYTQSATSKFAVDLESASSFDFVSIGTAGAGTADINGTIAVQTIGGYNPAQGTLFNVLIADAVTLNPSTLVTGTTPSGNGFRAQVVGGNTLQLEVIPEPTMLAPLAMMVPWMLRRRRRARVAAI
jgi:hypothetical protein